MARVNVDAQALLDPRFRILAGLMGTADRHAALGRMIEVWMQCIERETYVVTDSVIVALFDGETSAPAWLVTSELAEPVDGGLRIRGTEGRIEYLSKKRANARRNGTYGGRPRKPTLVTGDNLCRPPVETPPAPAPAPAPAPIKKPKATASRPVVDFPPELDTAEFKAAWSMWETFRREKRQPLTPTSISQQFKKLVSMGPARAIACIEHTIFKGWTGLQEPAGTVSAIPPQTVADRQRAQLARMASESSEVSQ